MKASRACFLILCLALLTGCGPREGHVISRQYSPAHTYTTTVIENFGSIKQPIWIPMTHTHYVPDRWYVTVTLDGTNFGTWSCDKYTFDSATNGAWFKCGVGIIPEPTVERSK